VTRWAGTRDSATLAIGSLISGLAAYGFIAFGNRAIGSTDFAAVSVLWTLWAMSAAVLTFPIQHWVIRTVEVDGGEGRIRRAIPRLLLAASAISVLFGLICWLFRLRLFTTGATVFPFLAALVPIGSVLMGLNRGVLASRNRFRSTAVAIAGENLIRLAVSIPMTSASGLGIALIAGFGVGAFWPSSFRLQMTGSTSDQGSPVAFVGSVGGGTLIGQVVMTSGPLVLAAIGGTPAEVTALFSALALFRAPYMVAIGVTPRLTADLTRVMLDQGDSARKRLVVRTSMVAVALLLLAASLGWAIGPGLLKFVFGPDVVITSWAAAVVAGASAIALCVLFLTVIMVAAARLVEVSLAWAGAALAGGLFLVIGQGLPIDRVAEAFLVAEVGVFILMVLALSSRRSLWPAQSRI
jgi:O-antigen/teichoic acid export membrane protein